MEAPELRRGFDFPLCRLAVLRLSVLFPSFTLFSHPFPPFQSLHQIPQSPSRTLTTCINSTPHIYSPLSARNCPQSQYDPQISGNNTGFRSRSEGHLPPYSLLSTVHEGLSKIVSSLDWIQSSHDIHRQTTFHAPSSCLQSLLLSSDLERATS